MSRPLRRLRAILTDALSAAFAQGDGAEEAIVRRLHQRLGDLRRTGRRLWRGGVALFAVSTSFLIAGPFLLDAGSWQIRSLHVAAVALMVTGAAGAFEGAQLATWIDALTDLLAGGELLGPLDILGILRQRLDDQLAGEPNRAHLVRILCLAYDTTPEIRGVLGCAGMDPHQVNLNQSPADVWHDALRQARRRGRLRALLDHVLADPEVQAYHPRIRAHYPSAGLREL
jgi:hypothetical protein